MTAKALEQISALLVRGNIQDAGPIFDDLMQSEIDDEDLMTIFRLFPRSLTSKHLKAFIEAEHNLESTVVSQALVQSKFAEIDAKTRAVALPLVVSQLEDDETFAAELYHLHLELVAAGKDTDDHARAAIIHAINTPSFFQFEALLESLRTAKFAAKDTAVSNLVKVVEDVLVGGSGVAGLEKAKSSIDKEILEEIDEQLLRKCQLLSLANLLKAGTEVPFSSLYEPLGVKEDEAIQQIAIDASLAGIIRIRVDFHAKVLHVHSSISLSFDTAAWKKLQEGLSAWQERVDKIVAEYDEK